MENKTFGEVLKEIRNKNGDSVRKLAENTGVSFAYVSQIENSKSPINKNYLEKLVKYYNLYKNTLEKAYLNEVLPDVLKTDAKNLDSRGKKQLNTLMEEVTLMFNDEEISEEAKEKMMLAVQEAFFIVKQKNKRKK